MAPAVTYDGVESTGGGNIFEGISFWVAHRVPMRKTILEHIENNGGRVVPLEKAADILIADHARKDCPPGSCSWKLITDSVHNGIIQLKDRYLIGPPTDAPRTAGSGGITRKARTGFTAQEDAELLKYVLSCPSDRTGNTIFMNYEAINSRHTWQSWRSRYTKKLQFLPMERQLQMVEGVPDLPLEAPVDRDEERLRSQGAVTREARRADSSATIGVQPPVPTARPKRADPASPPLPEHSDSSATRQSARMKRKRHENADQGDQATAHARDEPAKIEVTVAKPVGDSPEHVADEPATYTTEDQFYSDFEQFQLANEVEVDLHPVVHGRRITLWDLASAVWAQNQSPENTDWTLIAEDLGYMAAQTRRIGKDLLHLYMSSLLADFDEAMAAFAASEEDNVIALDEPEPAPGLSLIRPAENKPNTAPPEERHIGPRTKRQRLARDVEIPSTPDVPPRHTRQPQQKIEEPDSPSRRAGDHRERAHRRRVSFHPQTPEEQPGSDGGGAYKSQTQDFFSAPQHPADAITQLSSFDVSPSQQLADEEIAAEAALRVPLDWGRRDRDTSSSPDSLGLHSPEERSRMRKVVRRSLPTSFATPRSLNPPPPPQQQRGAPPEGNRTRHQRVPEPIDDEYANITEISRCIDYYMSLGYRKNIVVRALRSTTMTPGGQAALVMQSLQDGRGIPSHHEGVWTIRDDKSLQLVESTDVNAEPLDAHEENQVRKAIRAKDRLVKKHGAEAVELRREFLAAEEAEGQEDGH